MILIALIDSFQSIRTYPRIIELSSVYLLKHTRVREMVLRTVMIGWMYSWKSKCSLESRVIYMMICIMTFLLLEWEYLNKLEIIRSLCDYWVTMALLWAEPAPPSMDVSGLMNKCFGALPNEMTPRIPLRTAAAMAIPKYIGVTESMPVEVSYSFLIIWEKSGSFSLLYTRLDTCEKAQQIAPKKGQKLYTLEQNFGEYGISIVWRKF